MRLLYAASDATKITSTFRSKSRGVFDNVEAKVPLDREATSDGIRRGLDWLQKKMTWDDVAILFFSGHGAKDEIGQFNLVPVDADVNDVQGSCFSGRELKKSLENMPGRIIAMLDCCHSGSVAELSSNRRELTDDLARDLVTEDYGVIVMCSSLRREYSLESSATKAGFFTLGIVEGMNGQTDFNRDNVIYIHELDYYAGLRVRQLSRGLQNPVTGKPRGTRSYPLARP